MNSLSSNTSESNYYSREEIINHIENCKIEIRNSKIMVDKHFWNVKLNYFKSLIVEKEDTFKKIEDLTMKLKEYENLFAVATKAFEINHLAQTIVHLKFLIKEINEDAKKRSVIENKIPECTKCRKTIFQIHKHSPPCNHIFYEKCITPWF